MRRGTRKAVKVLTLGLLGGDAQQAVRVGRSAIKLRLLAARPSTLTLDGTRSAGEQFEI